MSGAMYERSREARPAGQNPGGRGLGSLFGSRAEFRARLADYLESAPGIDVGGARLHLHLDSVSVSRGFFSDTYKVGYNLTATPVGRSFDDAEAAQPDLRDLDDGPGVGHLYVAGFDSRDDFDAARLAFEANARERYQTAVRQGLERAGTGGEHPEPVAATQATAAAASARFE